jgi:hypothetical protein
VTRWRVDANSPEDIAFDSRAVIERQDLGQWDLRNPKTGQFIRPIVVIESVELYVPAKRRQKRNPTTGQLEPEPLNKLLISFVGKRKKMIAGATNRKAIESMYGFRLRDWIGKRIELYVDPHVTFGKRTTGGLRVSPKRPDGEPSAEPLDNDADADREREIAEARRELGFVEEGENG